MKVKFQINHDKKYRIFDTDNGRKIRDVKGDVVDQLKLKVLPEYILLKYKDQVLDNDREYSSYNIPDGALLSLNLEVTYYNESLGSKSCKAIMDHGCTEHQLRYRFKSEFENGSNTSCFNIHLQRETKLLESYLGEPNIVFIFDGKKDRGKKITAVILAPSVTKISLIVIKNLDGNGDDEGTKILIDKNCSVEQLRERISKELHIGLCDVDIYNEKNELVKEPLDKSGIRNDSRLTLRRKKNMRPRDEQFIIKVKNESERSKKEEGQRYLIDELETVRALKQILREQHNVHIDSIKLLSEGNELTDNSVIKELEIKNNSTFTMLIERKEERQTGEIKIKVRSCVGKDGDHKAKSVSIRDDASIEALRAQIIAVLRLSSADFVLSFNGDILRNENKISTYDIGEGAEVTVCHSLLVRYFVAGDSNSAKVHRYFFLPGDKVSDLKAKITTKLNLPARHINLSFDGNTLDDEMVLNEVGIENESYLMMVSTLAGGL